MPARRLALVHDGEDPSVTSKPLRIAFASADRKCVDQHFGSAEGFVVYEIDAGGARLVEALRFPPAAQDGEESKLAGRIAAIEGCDAVFVQAVGASAIRQLIKAGVHPVKTAPGAPLQPLVASVQTQLREAPAPWMTKTLSREKRADRFDAMADEDWTEEDWAEED